LIGLKKNLKNCDHESKRNLIDPSHRELSISRQCELLGISRGSYYYRPRGESAENLRIMDEIDRQFLETPFYGVKRFKAHVERSLKIRVNEKRIRRLMHLMGINAIYPKPKLSKPGKDHKIYPYLLRNVEIEHPDHVWSIDITYIRVRYGFMYLTAILDWFSRYVIAWDLSNSLEAGESILTLKRALSNGKPRIFNSDQGSQFTSTKFTNILEKSGIEISMDGRGRAFDNIFIERLWRSVKYDHVYHHDYADGNELYRSLQYYFELYNFRRLHESLQYRTPHEVYSGKFVNIGSEVDVENKGRNVDKCRRA